MAEHDLFNKCFLFVLFSFCVQPKSGWFQLASYPVLYLLSFCLCVTVEAGLPVLQLSNVWNIKWHYQCPYIMDSKQASTLYHIAGYFCGYKFLWFSLQKVYENLLQFEFLWVSNALAINSKICRKKWHKNTAQNKIRLLLLSLWAGVPNKWWQMSHIII